MKLCRCEHPAEEIDPRRLGCCVKCKRPITDPRWDSNDATLGAFFERLAESSFPAYVISGDKQHIPRWFFNFYRECSGRERAGRRKFGLQYLSRNNPLEAVEEAADLANYLHFELLRRRRLGEDEEADIALTGAWHAAKAYEAAQRMVSHSFPSLSSEDPENL